MATNEDKDKLFQKAIENINKSLMGGKNKSESEDNIISIFGDRPTNVETISTGSLVLDSISGGGFPKGRVIEVFGPAGSGKTSIALTALGNVQAEGKRAAFIDLENALDPSYATKLGVNMKELAFSQPETAEQALELVIRLADHQIVDMIVVDSVAALVPKAEIEGTMNEQTIGLVARLLGRALRKLVGIANKSGTTIVFINQTREKVGVMYGNPEVTTGGKALEFYCSQRIRVARAGTVTEGGEAIGAEVKLKVVKNKIAPPFKEGKTVLTHNRGINMAAELAEVGPDIGAIAKPTIRAWVDPSTPDSATGEKYDPKTNKGGYKFATSKADAVTALEKDSDLFGRIAERMFGILSGDDFYKIEKEESEESSDDTENVDTETGEIFDKED